MLSDARREHQFFKIFWVRAPDPPPVCAFGAAQCPAFAGHTLCPPTFQNVPTALATLAHVGAWDVLKLLLIESLVYSGRATMYFLVPPEALLRLGWSGRPGGEFFLLNSWGIEPRCTSRWHHCR